MAIEYAVKVHPFYVELTCRGAYALEPLLDILRDALEAGIDHARSAVLLDLRDVSGAPNKMERYELGSRFAKLQLSLDTLVTIAVVGHQPLIDPHRFAEMVALNRCAVGKVFEDHSAAVDWLEHTSG